MLCVHVWKDSNATSSVDHPSSSGRLKSSRTHNPGIFEAATGQTVGKLLSEAVVPRFKTALRMDACLWADV